VAESGDGSESELESCFTGWGNLLSWEGLLTTFNVLEHMMVPDHRIMEEGEIKSLLSTYHLTLEQLPKIYHDDPAVKAIKAKPGDVIRIVRESQTAGRAESYRLVIKRPKK
jgi:DNA-directed RNA polymerase subunit H